MQIGRFKGSNSAMKKKLITQLQLSRFTREQVAIYRHLIRRFSHAGM